MSRLQLLLYVTGYFVWCAYAMRRFWRAPGDEIVQALLGLLWPLCVAVYVLYRIFRWLGVRARTS